MICIDHKGFTAEQMNPKLHQRVLHREKFLVVDGVVLLRGLQLPGLESNHPLPPFGINLEQGTADDEVRGVAHDTERTIFVRQCQNRSALQALLDCLKGPLSLSGPRPIRILLQKVRQWPGQLGVVLAVLVQVVGEAKPIAHPVGK
jgi:hypothetical protein